MSAENYYRLVIFIQYYHTKIADYIPYLVPPSCEHIQKLGTDRSGFYKIDPDGFAIGAAPITVFCDFRTGATGYIQFYLI